jgi:hypothetical protein
MTETRQKIKIQFVCASKLGGLNKEFVYVNITKLR